MTDPRELFSPGSDEVRLPELETLWARGRRRRLRHRAVGVGVVAAVALLAGFAWSLASDGDAEQTLATGTGSPASIDPVGGTTDVLDLESMSGLWFLASAEVNGKSLASGLSLEIDGLAISGETLCEQSFGGRLGDPALEATEEGCDPDRVPDLEAIEPYFLDAVGGVPVIEGGRLVFETEFIRLTYMRDGEASCQAAGGPGALVAIDVKTGERLWLQTVGDANTVAVGGGVAATVGNSGSGLGVDIGTGKLEWCVQLGILDPTAGNIVSPGFAGVGDVVATMTVEGDVVALDAFTGGELWRTSVGTIEGARTWASAGSFYVNDFEGGPSRWIALDPDSGALVDASEPPEPGSVGNDQFRLRQARSGDSDGQFVEIAMEEATTGLLLWSDLRPGFTASVARDTVVVIDQTGGTGEIGDVFDLDSRVTAYEAETGALRWQVAVPGTPQQTFWVDSLVVVPVGSRLVAIDLASGTIAWDVDYGSPGQNSPFSLPGTYRVITADADQIIGLIVAEEPDRD